MSDELAKRDEPPSGWTSDTFAGLIAAVRGLENMPLPPDAERLVKTWPPRITLDLVNRPPAFIPYEVPPALPPATGHYSHAEMPWRCGRCGVPIVAWRTTAECVPGRMALPVYEERPALPPHV